MTGNPTHIGYARVDVAVVVVEDIAVREGGMQKVTRCRVGHPLGAASAPRGVEEEESVLAIHVLDGAIGAFAVHGFA